MNGRVLGLAFGIAGLAGASQGAITFSNFGPGDAYNTTTGWAIQGSNGNNQSIGEQFTASIGGVLQSIRLVLVGSEVPRLVNIILRQDSANSMGAQMVAWGHSLDSSGPIITLVNPFPNVSLTASSIYWLEVKAVDPDTISAWQYSNTGIGRLAWSSNGGTNYSYADGFAQGVFEVNVVPEPATWAAVGMGLPLLRRRNRAKA